MRFGIVLFTSDRGITPAAAAAAAEELGFDTFYVPEHTHIPVRRDAPHPGTGDGSLPDDRYLRTLDPWVALAMAAAVTSRIELATAVALPVEHDPITLAKTVATLDHLSGGRVTLGCGFGWNTDELADHNVPAQRRRTVLREYVEAMRALWRDERAEYRGDFVSFGPSWAYPKPVRRDVPVLVGAGGTDKTFAWIARSADGWITTPRDDDVVARVARLHEIWHSAGRKGAPRVVALDTRPDPGRLAQWAGGGVTDVVYGLPDRDASDIKAYLDRLRGKLGTLEPAG
jgi:probable F420-dependent oxidoreductase